MELRQLRWRLVLGEGVEELLGGTLEGGAGRQDRALGYLYNREYGGKRNVRGGMGVGEKDVDSGQRRGGLEESQLSVPEWINEVHELFPQKTIERIEKDALERYKLEEMVTNPEVLQRARPNQTLLKAVLHTKHLMNKEVLAMAQTLVRKVIEELMKKLAREISQPFSGTPERKRSFLKIAKNFDAKATIRYNLKHYDPEQKRLFIHTPYFHSRVRRRADKWQIIIVIDQSGSMLDSVIHAAVTAAIFHGMQALRTHLIIFDTSVIDLTEDCTDPVETLMKVQLGGGTDIGQAVEYAERLIENPRRTIIVLVTDFYEGAPVHRLYEATRRIIEGGTYLLGLAALDSRAEPSYDHGVANHMAVLGAHVGAMTPGELAEWVAEKVK